MNIKSHKKKKNSLGFIGFLFLASVLLLGAGVAIYIAVSTNIVENTSFSTAESISENVYVNINIAKAEQKRYYSFTPTKAGFYTIESFSETNNINPTDSQGWLYNSSRSQLVSMNHNKNNNFLMVYHFEGGQQYFVAAGCVNAETGNYRLRITQTTNTLNNVTAGFSPETLPPATAESVNINTEFKRVYFSFTAPVDGDYVFESFENFDSFENSENGSESGSSDPYGRLFDTDSGEVLAENNDIDGAENRNFRITTALKEGQTVFLTASCYGNGKGSYSVSAEGFVKQDLDYTESTELVKNPFMGYPSAKKIRLTENGLNIVKDVPDNGFVFYYVNLQEFSSGNNHNGNSNPLPPNSKNKEISDNALNGFRVLLENLRKNGGSAYIRFVYDWDGVVGCEPSNLSVILGHIEQLCSVVGDYADVILWLQCGIIGPWGEMHSSNYNNKDDSNAIIETYLNNTPDSIGLSVRSPSPISNYLGIDYTALSKLETKKGSDEYRLGYYNDGYMGTDWDYGTWKDRKRDLQFLFSQNHTPYGGEFAYSFGYLPTSTAHLPQNAIPEMYQTHLNYIDGNIFTNDFTGGVFGYEDYVYGPDYEEEWFPDNSAFYGKDCYDFIRMHLGYRLVLRDSYVSLSAKAGGTLGLYGEIENTGFANVLHQPKAQILLEKDDAVYICDVNLNVFDIKSATKNIHSLYKYNLTAELPDSLQAGDYNVYLRFSGSGASEYAEYAAAKSGIRFANVDVLFNKELGANKLGTVRVQSN